MSICLCRQRLNGRKCKVNYKQKTDHLLLFHFCLPFFYSFYFWFLVLSVPPRKWIHDLLNLLQLHLATDSIINQQEAAYKTILLENHKDNAEKVHYNELSSKRAQTQGYSGILEMESHMTSLKLATWQWTAIYSWSSCLTLLPAPHCPPSVGIISMYHQACPQA